MLEFFSGVKLWGIVRAAGNQTRGYASPHTARRKGPWIKENG